MLFCTLQGCCVWLWCSQASLLNTTCLEEEEEALQIQHRLKMRGVGMATYSFFPFIKKLRRIVRKCINVFVTIPWGQQRWRLGKGIGLRCPGWPSHKPLSIRLSIRSYGNVSPINQPINASLSNSPWVFSSLFFHKAQNGMKLDPPMRLFICHLSPPTIERWRNLVRIAFGWMDRLLCNLLILHMHALQCVKCQFESSFSEKSLKSFYSLSRWQMDGIINLKCQLVQCQCSFIQQKEKGLWRKLCFLQLLFFTAVRTPQDTVRCLDK